MSKLLFLVNIVRHTDSYNTNSAHFGILKTLRNGAVFGNNTWLNYVGLSVYPLYSHNCLGFSNLKLVVGINGFQV